MAASEPENYAKSTKFTAVLKEIVIAIEAFFRAHRFIKKHKLWRWILIPGLLYMILFMAGMYFFWKSSDSAISYLSNLIGISKWLHALHNQLISFLFTMGELMLRLVLLSFYFSLFKYLFLIIGSPVFSYLSEKTEAIIEGKTYDFSMAQLWKDMQRGIKLSARNALWQTVYVISLIILSLIPLVGWITPVILLFIECYYYGFSMLDYSCERHQLSASKSVEFIGKHKGLAIGNGMVFYLMHLVPFVGWLLAPAYAVIAATISLYHWEEQT